jgi:hypothetical protein
MAGKKLARERNNLSFVGDFLGAMGWGDIYTKSREEVKIGNYPWTRFTEDVDFEIIRGMVSGMITEILGENVKFRSYETKLGDELTLILHAE